MMEKEIKLYIKRIKALISLNSIEEKKFINQLKEQIDSSYANKDISDYNSLVEKYGTPNEVANSYLATQDPIRFIKCFNIKKLCLSTFVLLLLSILFINMFRLYKYQQYDKEAVENGFILEHDTNN